LAERVNFAFVAGAKGGASARTNKRKSAAVRATQKALTNGRAPIGGHASRVRELEDELRDLRGELERSERRVEAMKQIGRALGSHLDLTPLLAEIVSRTTDLLEADRSTLFLIDHEKNELWSKVLEGTELLEIRLKSGEGLAGWVAKNGKALHVPDPYADKRFNPDFDKKSGYRTRCMLVWPVKRPKGGEVIGVIQVLNKRHGAFNGTDERLLEAIASEIGVALEVSTLYREAVDRSKALERARGELMLLFETERAISQSEDLNEMLVSILDTALSALSARSGAIHLVEDDGTTLSTAAAAGVHAPALKNDPVKDSVAERVWKSGEPVVENDLNDVMRGRLIAKSIAAVPIQLKHQGTIGVFELINKKERRGFTRDDVKALSVVASQAGRAISAEMRRKERERSERLTTIGRMLSGVVHDLRTPLTLISGYAQIMALSDSAADREQYAHLVLKQIDVVSAMTKDLLAFARGERSILIRKVYVQNFMKEMRDSIEKELEGSNVELDLEVKYKGAARFDETKMRRVFHNIARNAREAMPGGGKFTITVSDRDGELVFDFQDTGGGIPAELEGKLFVPFSTAGKVGGTGLGLAMVKQIAGEHGGSVGYVSSKKGARFTFRIPLEH
jgi:signal transduction histidine kinase